MAFHEGYHEQRAMELGLPLGTGKDYNLATLLDTYAAYGDPTPEIQPIAIEFYASEWFSDTEASYPDQATAQAIADLFVRNYPPAHDIETRRHDVNRYRYGSQIKDQIDDGNVWLVARGQAGEVVGALKFRDEKRGDGDTRDMLISWVLVEGEYRKHNVAAQMVEKASALIRQFLGANVDFVADVHQNNGPSRGLFNRLGFAELQGKDSSHLLMRRRA